MATQGLDCATGTRALSPRDPDFPSFPREKKENKKSAKTFVQAYALAADVKQYRKAPLPSALAASGK